MLHLSRFSEADVPRSRTRMEWLSIPLVNFMLLEVPSDGAAECTPKTFRFPWGFLMEPLPLRFTRAAFLLALATLPFVLGTRPAVAVSWSNPHHAYIIFRSPSTNNFFVKEISVDKNPSVTRILGGSRTGFCQIFALAVGPKGNLYVSGIFGSNCKAGTVGIEIFAPGAFGNVAPIASILGSKTKMDETYGMAFDGAGRLYAAEPDNRSLSGQINVYAAGATGNVAPIEQLGGPRSMLAVPLYVAVDDAGEIFVGQVSGGSKVLKFRAGARGNAAPVANVTVEPNGHGFNELQVSGGTVYAAIGDLRQETPTIYELSAADLSQTGALTNPKFSLLAADADSAANLYVQNQIRSRDGGTRGHLNEFEAGMQQPSRVRFDGATYAAGYVVVGP